jgi:hypothetical protein
MTTTKDKLCAFCDRTLSRENRSKEHILPQWLLDFLEIRDENIQPTHFSSNGETLTTRHHTLEGLLAGQVCEECNNGWMSQLEQDALPILKPLMLGETTVVERNENERQIISRWTAKTAFALNSASNYLKNVPLEHYQYVRLNNDSLPMNVSSFGQQHHGVRPFYWIQSPTWLLNGKSDKLLEIGTKLKDNSYKISFQFGKLMLLICYIPIENIYPVLWKGIHIPLFPKSGKCGYYENREFSWSNSEKALNEFHFGLQATIIQ